MVYFYNGTVHSIEQENYWYLHRYGWISKTWCWAREARHRNRYDCLTMSLTFKSSSSFSSTPFPPYFLSFLLLLLQKLQPKSSSCYFGRFPVLPKGSRITSELQSYINLAIFNFLNSSTIYPLSSCPQLTIWPQPALSLA